MNAPAVHSSRYHCELGPSSSKRWINCPGSVLASRGHEDKGSVYADEGTAAHELAQHCLENGWDAHRFAGWFIDIHASVPALMFLQSGEHAPEAGVFEVDHEMVDGVQLYVDTCRHWAEMPGAEVLFEERVFVSEDPEINGTCDFGVYFPETRHVAIWDFKYGRGVTVLPHENPQAMLYALGLINRLNNRGVEKVTIGIVQPRTGHEHGLVRPWETDPVELLEFEYEALEAARLALQPGAPFKAGEWCKFCPIGGRCATRDAAAYEQARAQFDDHGEMTLTDPATADPEWLAARLEHVDRIEEWCEAIRKHAHAHMEQGRSLPGYKLVAKRANRQWKEGAAELVADTYNLSEEQLYQPRKVKTPAQIEPMLPGKNKDARKALLSPYVSADSKGTVVVPVTDPRPAIGKDAASQFEDLSDGA